MDTIDKSKSQDKSQLSRTINFGEGGGVGGGKCMPKLGHVLVSIFLILGGSELLPGWFGHIFSDDLPSLKFDIVIDWVCQFCDVFYSASSD